MPKVCVQRQLDDFGKEMRTFVHLGELKLLVASSMISSCPCLQGMVNKETAMCFGLGICTVYDPVLNTYSLKKVPFKLHENVYSY